MSHHHRPSDVPRESPGPKDAPVADDHDVTPEREPRTDEPRTDEPRTDAEVAHQVNPGPKS